MSGYAILGGSLTSDETALQKRSPVLLEDTPEGHEFLRIVVAVLAGLLGEVVLPRSPHLGFAVFGTTAYLALPYLRKRVR